MSEKNYEEIHVLVFRDGDLLIAQCLEYDIAVQAKELIKLQDLLVSEIIEQIKLDIQYGEEPLSTTPKTPQSFWDMLDKSCFDAPMDFNIPDNFDSNYRKYIPKRASLTFSEAPCVSS